MARTFNGTTDHGLAADHANLDLPDAEWSVVLWLRPDISQVDREAVLQIGSFSSTPWFQIEILAAGTLRAQLTGTTGSGTPGGTTNMRAADSWKLVVLERNATDIRFYVDGVNQGNAIAATIGAIANTTGLRVGAEGGGSSNFYAGAIGPIYIFKRLLTAAENAALLAGDATDPDWPVPGASGAAWEMLGDADPEPQSISGGPAGIDVTGTTQSATHPVTYASGTPPAAPSGAAAAQLSAGVNRVTWTDNASDEANFVVERAPDVAGAPGTYVELSSAVAANAVQYDDTTATPGSLYWYRVKARNASGDSAYSTTAAAVTTLGVTAITGAASGTSSDSAAAQLNVSITGEASGASTDTGTLTLTYSVMGTVTLDGAPVSGALIYLINQATDAVVGTETTAVDGTYEFTGVPAGTYHAVAEYAGHSAPSVSGIVVGGG